MTTGPGYAQSRPQNEWPYRRQLTTVEARAKVDPVSLDDRVNTIMGDLMQQWPKLTREWARELADQVEAALDSGDSGALAQLQVTAEKAGDELAAAVLAAAQVGVDTSLEEADAQGAAAGDPEVDEESLTDRARTAAQLLAVGYALSAGREALRLWDPAREPADVTDDVLAHLGNLSDAGAKDTLGGMVQLGVNAGRQAGMASVEGKVRFYASEVRDRNTCENCVTIDGYEFASQAEADASYPTGGYIDCLGRFRCRGIVIAVYGEED